MLGGIRRTDQAHRIEVFSKNKSVELRAMSIEMPTSGLSLPSYENDPGFRPLSHEPLTPDSSVIYEICTLAQRCRAMILCELMTHHGFSSLIELDRRRTGHKFSRTRLSANEWPRARPIVVLHRQRWCNHSLVRYTTSVSDGPGFVEDASLPPALGQGRETGERPKLLCRHWFLLQCKRRKRLATLRDAARNGHALPSWPFLNVREIARRHISAGRGCARMGPISIVSHT